MTILGGNVAQFWLERLISDRKIAGSMPVLGICRYLTCPLCDVED